eukprot:scaffold53974_cov59-Phaeocystis_antarctica.AAC.3
MVNITLSSGFYCTAARPDRDPHCPCSVIVEPDMLTVFTCPFASWLGPPSVHPRRRRTRAPV